MCVVIDADCVVANLFAAGQRQVTVRDLNLLRQKLEQRFEDLYIDVCGDTICMIVDERPDLFRWEDDGLSPAEKREGETFSEGYVREYFNWRVPEHERKDFEKLCRETATT